MKITIRIPQGTKITAQTATTGPEDFVAPEGATMVYEGEGIVVEQS